MTRRSPPTEYGHPLSTSLDASGGPAIRSGPERPVKSAMLETSRPPRQCKKRARGQLAHYERSLRTWPRMTERILADVRAPKPVRKRIVAEAMAHTVVLQEEARQIIEHERAHRQAAIHTLVERAIEGGFAKRS